jgi:hypothetical protein
MSNLDLERYLLQLAKSHNRTVDLLVLTATIASIALVVAVLAYNR